MQSDPCNGDIIRCHIGRADGTEYTGYNR